MRDAYVAICPYCGGTEMIETCQDGYAAVTATSNVFGGGKLYHSVCRKCGSVVRSYVKDPEKLLKKKDRKKEDSFEFQEIPEGFQNLRGLFCFGNRKKGSPCCARGAGKIYDFV